MVLKALRSHTVCEQNVDSLYTFSEYEKSLTSRIFGNKDCLSNTEQKYLLTLVMWNEEQSQKRIPFNRRSCADLITRASRFERLISLGAPEIVVTEEGRCLAEEMVLYYFGKEEPIVWD